MTTIAARAGQIAADTLTNTGGLRDYMTKLIVDTDAIVGIAGSICESRILAEWYLDGGNRNVRPNWALYGEEKPECHILVLMRNKSIWTVDRTLVIEPVIGDFWAIGSGAAAALGAMHMGASAFEAVEVACKVDISTGGQVEMRRFEID